MALRSQRSCEKAFRSVHLRRVSDFRWTIFRYCRSLATVFLQIWKYGNDWSNKIDRYRIAQQRKIGLNRLILEYNKRKQKPQEMLCISEAGVNFKLKMTEVATRFGIFILFRFARWSRSRATISSIIPTDRTKEAHFGNSVKLILYPPLTDN